MTLRLSRRRGATIAFAAVVLRALAAAVLALVLPLGPGLVANASDSVAAHNELLSSDPLDGAQLEAGPARVTLTWDLPAQRGFSTVVVTGPDGNQWQAGPATEDGTVVSAPVRPLGPAGEYTAAYRIISADGHPVRGAVRFTLITPGTGTPATPPPNADRSNSATPATDTGSVGTLVWPWLAGVGVLLVAGVVLALRASRTRG